MIRHHYNHNQELEAGTPTRTLRWTKKAAMAAGFPYAHRPNGQMSSMVMTTARRPPLAARRPLRTAHRPAVPPSNHLPPDDLTTPCTAPLLHLATFTRTGDDGLKLSHERYKDSRTTELVRHVLMNTNNYAGSATNALPSARPTTTPKSIQLTPTSFPLRTPPQHYPYTRSSRNRSLSRR